ncbi:hypothetical protein XENTR_v10000208 [Xenopus tropicalis]|uniref:ALMS1, centrosome and basal body associated protein n=1 Tax=Xenopus tropicalis TaxID=8364 RepID=A0A6I8SIX7_XENTR|nr:uncharacterized protein alms1 isoform X1 [Xenopus tropicalis]KAE8628762.1 hypothetical protein XENTR_v10000208 [Xenopus tropicalis]
MAGEAEKPLGTEEPTLIATTPPVSRFYLLEEDVSQSSSPGTQISSASGISLGEAIRQSASKGMESWYQLPAEEDASSIMPPLSETGALAEQTEFPTLEEGTLHSEPDETKGHALGLVHSIQFETQDSRLSPCLPLLISTSTQGHKLFDETLYQQTELDFAPLSGSLDISEFPGHTTKSLLISDAVTLTAKEVSLDVAGENVTLTQNPLPLSPEEDHETTNLHYLSQHPLPSTQKDFDFAHLAPTISDTDKTISETLQAAPHDEQYASPIENLDMVFSQEDGSFLDSSVPAPVLLELLEKEVGISGSSEVSSTSSSSENVSNKKDLHSEEQTYNRSQMQGLDGPGKTSDQYLLEGETFRDSSEIDFNAESFESAESLHASRPNRSHHSGITVRLAKGPPSVPGNNDLHKELCAEIQQRYRDRMLRRSAEGLNEKDTSSLTEAFTDPNSGKDDTVVEVHSSMARDELTISSRCSIERGHKDSEISPAVNPTAEDNSFIGRLAYPISQSTPGTFTGKSGKNQLTGRLMQIKAKLTGSNMSLNEEPLSNASTEPVFKKPQSLQSSRGYAESSDSQTSQSPDRRRIQSLPSLNYIEKVGAWNTNQSFDALVLRGLTGISPKKKAYNAVADSLNRMLSKQSDSALPKSGLSAMSRGTGSMNNLNATKTDPSGTPQLIRSQSCTTVPMGSTERADANTQGEVVIPVSESHDVQRVDKVLPMDYNFSDHLPRKEQPVDYKEAIDMSGSSQEIASQTQQPKADVGSSTVAMDRFSDVSPDNELLSSSCSSGHTNQMHSLTSLEVDNYVPLWAASPEEVKEINIEERIPTYLRNLGIDQSPTTILTPFAPKGPIREPEFSPSELRTIKGSTATPNRSMRFSEGGSQSAADVSQSSLYSTASTTSVSIPMGSDAGRDSPLQTEMLSQFSSSSTRDRPISQCDMATRFGEDNETLLPGLKSEKVETGILGHEFQSVEISAVPPLSMELQCNMESTEASNRVKQLIDHFECKTISPDQHVSSTSDVEATDFFGLASVSGIPLQKPAMEDSFSSGSVSGIPLQKPAMADSFSLASVSGIPLQKQALADSFSLASVSGIPLQKPALADSFSLASVSGIPLQKPALADSFSSASVSGIPLQKPFLADSFSSVSVSGIPLQKPAMADSFSSVSVSGIPLQKPAMADSFSSVSVSGIPLQKPAMADSFSSVSVSGIPLQKPAMADSFSSMSVSGIPLQKPALDSVNDSFVGSKTLKEIRKLLAEAETVGFDESAHGYSFSSRVKDISSSSLPMWLKTSDSVAPTAGNSRFTSLGDGQLPEISWDASLSSSLTYDNLQMKDSPVKVGWDDSLASTDKFKDSTDLEKELEGQNQPIPQFKQEKLFERAEPEGFSEVMAVNKVTFYAPFRDGRRSDIVNTISEATECTSGHLHSITSAVRGLEQAQVVTGLSYGRLSEKATESDDSSADSLAGRVKSLLKKDAPLMHTAQTGTSTDGKEAKTRASMQLKLANCSSITETILNDEDRRRIEEIKRELIEGAKESQLGQNPCCANADRMSDHWRKSEPFRLHMTPSPDLGQSSPRMHPKLLERAPEQLAPLTTAETFNKENAHTYVKEESRLLEEAFVPQTLKLTDLDFREASGTKRELSQQGAPAHPPLSGESSKPVTSITFSSRKRSSPLSLSSSSERTCPAETSPAVRPRSHDGSDPNKLILSAPAKSLSVSDTPVVAPQDTPASHLATEYRHWQHSPTPDSSECSLHAHNSFALCNLTCTDNEGSITSLAPQISPYSHPDFHEDVPLTVGLDQSFHSEHSSYRTEGIDGRAHSSPEPCMPASHPAAASPARKAISCVHVQISPKQEDSKKLDFDPKLLSGSACVNNVAKLQAEEPDLSPSRAANLPGKEGALIKQDLADEKLTLSSLHLHTKPSDSGIRPPVSSLSTPESAASVVLGRIPLHDATTQITTESPAKTTFSAEIFIDSREKDIISRSPDVTANTTPERQPLYHARLSPATDQPLLVPYRPHGSPELFYVPYTDGLSRISPVSTIESSHTGSNDAVSPKFPVEVLGSGTDSLSDSAMVRHKEGIYSKGSSPKLAWEASTAPHKGNSSETLPTISAVRHTLEKEPEHQMGSDTKPPRTALTQGNFQYERDSRLDNQRERPSLLSSHTEDNEFFPLTPEIDFNRDQRRDGSPSLRWNSPAEGSLLRNAKTISFPFSKSSPSLKVTGSSPLPGKVSPTSLGGRSVTNGRNGENSYTNGRYMSVTRESDGHKRLHKSQATLDQSSVSQQSLDDLWARYTNRKKLQQSESKSNHELSLVERLDRLARLLHNSSSHSPLSAKDEPLADLEQSKNHVKERSWEGSGHKGERWYDKKLSGTGLHVGGRYSLDEIDITSHADESSVGSDLYPLLQSAKSDSAPSETGTATQTGSEVTTQTLESSSTLKTVSSSASTIDTIRLINAFGPERVCPSSRLSRLYSAIDLQKRRSEESTGKPSRNPAARIDTGGLHRSLNKTPESVSSASTSDSSWQPRPALKSKRSNKYLNKGVQAGNLEIVNSATKKNTRDVGTVFPSPRGDPHKPLTQGHGQKEERFWDSSVFTQRGGRSKQVAAQGLSWFVPTEDLKSDSRKENRSDMKKGPSVSWYEPLTNTKPWREPLREKNVEEVRDQLNKSHLDPPENKALKPFVKVTLQESLKTHRPDFIFRSGERVKRLHLIAEERKLQTVFQSEREKLFNQPAKAGEWETAQQQLQDYRLNQKNRMIPKKEMVQHSKRIYEQLPEVKKRREAEKRRQEYESYRLKAQLFQKKVTNHVLGRKTPWN